MAREPIPSWYFVLVVARWENRFLVVREVKHGQRWYLPAGRVEPGETFAEAAHRETWEESGVRIELTGILKVQHTPLAQGSRVRVLYLAQPVGDPTPRVIPNEHSLEARWVTLDEVGRTAIARSRGARHSGMGRRRSAGGATGDPRRGIVIPP